MMMMMMMMSQNYACCDMRHLKNVHVHFSLCGSMKIVIILLISVLLVKCLLFRDFYNHT